MNVKWRGTVFITISYISRRRGNSISLCSLFLHCIIKLLRGAATGVGFEILLKSDKTSENTINEPAPLSSNLHMILLTKAALLGWPTFQQPSHSWQRRAEKLEFMYFRIFYWRNWNWWNHPDMCPCPEFFNKILCYLHIWLIVGSLVLIRTHKFNIVILLLDFRLSLCITDMYS